MKNLFQTSAPTMLFILGFFMSAAFVPGSSLPLQDADSDLEYEVRPHELGINGFYTAEFKRLPVYDFGLGKRFDREEYEDYPFSSSDDDEDSIPELELYHDDSMQTVEKRPDPYNFGLGKRQRNYDFGLGKRGHHKYDFGLGKRSQSYRDKIYNMGLGKRTRMYSFGLGKRPSSPGVIGSRFNFGLGKRSEDVTSSQIAKRDVQGNNPDPGKGNKGSQQEEGQDVSKHSAMGHLVKRSPYGYSFRTGDDSVNLSSDIEFSRQFRNPLYNFGLGKRSSSSSSSSSSSNEHQKLKSSNK